LQEKTGYRKDWFAQAGRKPPTTFDDFLTAAKNQYGFGLRGAAGRTSGWPSWWPAARDSWTRRGR